MNPDVLSKLEKILERMAESAKKQGIKGVAVAAYYEKDSKVVSQAQVCGALTNPQCNYLAIAYGKLSEMCTTLKDSGTQERKPLLGELGYQGGAIKPAGKDFYIAAFSGGTGEEDLAASKYGLEIV